MQDGDPYPTNGTLFEVLSKIKLEDEICRYLRCQDEYKTYEEFSKGIDRAHEKILNLMQMNAQFNEVEIVKEMFALIEKCDRIYLLRFRTYLKSKIPEQ